jgi:hypothetical protein
VFITIVSNIIRSNKIFLICSMLRGQKQFMIYFRLILEFNFVCQSRMFPIWSAQTCLFSPINLVHLSLPWKQKEWGVILAHRRNQCSGEFGKLTHGDCLDCHSSTEVWSHCTMLRGQSQFMIIIYFRLFLELDLVCQTGM